MANYASEMKALEQLMKQQEQKEANERTNVTEGSQIANMLSPLSNRSQYSADILMDYKPEDRSSEMTQAWTGGASSRMQDALSKKQDLLNKYKMLQTQQGQANELDIANKKFNYQQGMDEKKLGLAEKGLGLKEKQLADANRYKERQLALESQRLTKDAKGNEKPTIGESTLDRKFAGTYNDYVNEGGAVTIDTNINKMKTVLNKLKSGQVQTGGVWSKVTPTSGKMGAIANPSIVAVQEELQSAIQNTLRPILGGQFAAVEGQQIMERAFNPNLSTEVNIKRIENEIRNLEKRADVMNKSVAYYEDNGTLKGYKGSQALESVKDDTYTAKAPKKSSGGGIINEAYAGDSNSYDDMDDEQLDKLLGL